MGGLLHQDQLLHDVSNEEKAGHVPHPNAASVHQLNKVNT